MASDQSVRDMTIKFTKLENFEGVDFRRWQKKMHFLLTTLKVVYVLSTPMPEVMVDEMLEMTRRCGKWENDDYICRGHILNGMCESLFDIYQNVESAKELWDSLESNYMAEDASSKKFLKDFKHMLKHKKKELSLVQLGSHLHIEESLRAQETEKPKMKEVSASSVNMVEEGRSNNFKGKRKFNEAKKGPNKKDDDDAWWIDTGASSHVCKDRRWFITLEPVEDGSVLHMGNESNAPILGRGLVKLEFSSRKIIELLDVLFVPQI
ncbi:hypothetical protein L6452_40840 [Arctium lappa]|uniref:Uncharacterized protein n=1 Tax=Arctium lappa TaxID=4217 RepID=A0ACB8XMZ6_ARCLA|nr:hypothetical protein L6452_40840 [Arctium lappa]